MNAPDIRQIVVGIGNRQRGDDAAGRAVIDLLRIAPPAGIELIEQEGEATMLLEQLAGADRAYLVDACSSGAPPGTVHRFDVAGVPLPHAGFSMSTHGMGLAEAIELARVLGQLPSCCVVYAIEGHAFEAGAPLSPAVADAVAKVAARLQGDMIGYRKTTGQDHA